MSWRGLRHPSMFPKIKGSHSSAKERGLHLLCHRGIRGEGRSILYQPHTHEAGWSQLLLGCLEAIALQFEVPSGGGFPSTTG